MAVDVILVLDSLQEVQLAELHFHSIHDILDAVSVGDQQFVEGGLGGVVLGLLEAVGELELVDLFGDLEEDSLGEETVDLGQTEVVVGDLEEPLGEGDLLIAEVVGAEGVVEGSDHADHLDGGVDLLSHHIELELVDVQLALGDQHGALLVEGSVESTDVHLGQSARHSESSVDLQGCLQILQVEVLIHFSQFLSNHFFIDGFGVEDRACELQIVN